RARASGPSRDRGAAQRRGRHRRRGGPWAPRPPADDPASPEATRGRRRGEPGGRRANASGRASRRAPFSGGPRGRGTAGRWGGGPVGAPLRCGRRISRGATMTEHRERVLRIERSFDAPVEKVFEAWTSEEVLRRWLHGMPGWETPTADVDLRVGGRIRIVMRDP